jgi:hypothetical protein
VKETNMTDETPDTTPETTVEEGEEKVTMQHPTIEGHTAEVYADYVPAWEAQGWEAPKAKGAKKTAKKS